MTTLTTTGYGDFLPRTQNEMILCSVIMLCGVAFFSYIMSSFINIISSYDKRMGDDAVNREAALTDWLTLVTRFRGNQEGGAGQPLPRELMHQIERHVTHHWENNRLRWLEPEFLREEDQESDGEEIAERLEKECASAVELAEDDEYLVVLPKQLKRNVSL
jgi:Ion channel